MTSFIRLERAALCATARDVGPDAPTLCEGWDVRDLVVHLLVRERRPWAAGGIVVPALRGLTERASAAMATRSFDQLLDLYATPPALLQIDALDRTVNGTEIFIHHEDIRRAQPEWTPRELPAGLEAALWSGLRLLGRMAARRAGVPLVVSDGTRTVTLRGGESPVRLTGPVSELILALTGRTRLADLQRDGTPEQLAALHAADLSL